MAHAPSTPLGTGSSTIRFGDDTCDNPQVPPPPNPIPPGVETTTLLAAAFTWAAIAWEMGCSTVFRSAWFLSDPHPSVRAKKVNVDRVRVGQVVESVAVLKPEAFIETARTVVR